MHKHTLDLRHLIRQCPDCSRRFSQDAVFCPFDGARLLEAQRPDDKLDPLIGQTVDGRYAIEGILGEGGMGTVYRARHVTLGRALALKVLRSDLARETELAARFLQEAQATAAIKHPNIVSITDFGRMPDARPYFVMELLSGRTLAALLKAGGALPARQATRIAMAIAAGLEAAHAARVVHRDLKPENVFLISDDGSELRIVDFGAALVMGGSRLTKAGIVFGTPHYMSPEQAGGKTVDHRADVYALGIILYEMLTGRVPFEGDTYMGVLTQHMFVAPPPPSQILPSLGKLGAIESVVLRALEKEPEARFASMLAFEEALGSALESRGATPSWPAPVRPSAPPPRGIADDLELPTMGEIRDRLSQNEGLERRGRMRTVVTAVVAIAVIVLCVGIGLHVYSANSSATPVATSTPTATLTPAPTPTPTPTPTPAASTAPEASSAPLPAVIHTAKPVHTPRPSSTAVTNSALGPDPFEHH